MEPECGVPAACPDSRAGSRAADAHGLSRRNAHL